MITKASTKFLFNPLKKHETMNKIQLIFFLVVAGFCTKAQQPLTLTDAITKALENNYGIVMVKKDQQIAEIRNNWGNAGRYPYINLSLSDDNSYNINETENFANNRFSAGASLSWTLFDGFSVRINKQRFEELEQLSKQNTAIMVEGTIQSVILAYYDVLLQNEKLKNWEEIMQLSSDRYKQAEERKAFGTYVTYDVLQAKNAYLTDRSGYLLQEVNYKNSMRDLNFLMAEQNDMVYSLTDSFSAIPVDYKLADLQAQMIENNKGLQNQYVNQRLLENAVAAAKSNFYPTFDFRGGVTGTANRNNFADRGESWGNSANFYGNFTLSYNLYSGGNRKRAVDIAAIEESIGLVEIDEMKHELNNSLSNLYEFYLLRQELLTLAFENLEAAKLNLQLSKERFEAGTINSFNYRDVQVSYITIAQRQLEAVYNFINAQTALLRMTGTIIQEYE
jgi:outer membrane protein TolC